MFESLYDPWDAVPLAFIAAAVLLVLGGVALRKTHGEIISRTKYFGYAACSFVAAAALVLITANLYWVESSIPSNSALVTTPFPATPLVSVWASAILVLTALFTVGYCLTRVHNLAWTAASVVWLGVTVTLLSDVGFYRFYDGAWLPAGTIGWYVTLVSTVALVAIVARQQILAYGKRQFASGLEGALKAASDDELSTELMDRKQPAG